MSVVQLGYRVEATQALEAVAKVKALTSPAGLASWLSGQMGPHLISRMEDRFAKEGDDAVGKWELLSEATVFIREGQGYPGDHPINVRTGEMFRYLVSNSNVDVSTTAEGATLVYPGTDTVGDLADKLATAQGGADSPSTPARPVLGLSAVDLGWGVSSLTAFINGVSHIGRG
jgi:hypothetical protein